MNFNFYYLELFYKTKYLFLIILNKVLYLSKIFEFMKKKLLSMVSLSAIFMMNAQEKDSLHQKKIEEVVITGQYVQQSINKSIYKVEVIDSEQIKKYGGNFCGRSS